MTVAEASEPGASGPITFTYDQDDRWTGASYPNGVTVSNAYDPDVGQSELSQAVRRPRRSIAITSLARSR
jgi:hypothetical protein